MSKLFERTVSSPHDHLVAGATGLEPAASCVTGRRSNQLNYAPAYYVVEFLPVPSGRAVTGQSSEFAPGADRSHKSIHMRGDLRCIAARPESVDSGKLRKA